VNGLRDQLRELFPADTRVDWDDVLVRARGQRQVRRLLLPLLAVVAAVLVVGSALALSGRFDRLLHGSPVKDLTPQERYILSEFDLKGRVELIATHGSSTFYVFRTREGSVCYSIGQTRKGLTPAQTELRPRFGSLGCLRRGTFPSRALPVLDFSAYRMAPGGPPELFGLEGFAADPVDKIGVIGRDNRIVYRVDVEDNVYSKRRLGITGVHGIVALDEDGEPLWVQCPARRGCGKYKNSPPPAVPPPPKAKKATRRQGPVVVQRGAANGVTVVVRGAEIEASFDRMPAAALKLLRGKRARITVGCFRLVTFAGRRFSDGAAVSTTFAAFVRARLSSGPGRRFTAPFDGCIATGIYGHTWNDAHGTHDLVEVPLTAKGRGFFAERAAARDIAWLARARVFKAVRYAQRPFTPATAAAYLAERVDPLEGPSDTPPVGRLGIWLGPDRRIVVVERAPTGRRLFLELRRGVIYRTNLGGLTQVL